MTQVRVFLETQDAHAVNAREVNKEANAGRGAISKFVPILGFPFA